MLPHKPNAFVSVFFLNMMSTPGHNLQVRCGNSQKANRKVQGVPQSQTAANPRHQEEEKNEKN